MCTSLDQSVFPAHWCAEHSKNPSFLAGGISESLSPFSSRLRRSLVQNFIRGRLQYRQLRRLHFYLILIYLRLSIEERLARIYVQWWALFVLRLDFLRLERSIDEFDKRVLENKKKEILEICCFVSWVCIGIFVVGKELIRMFSSIFVSVLSVFKRAELRN